MNILLTGGAGFIGSHIFDRLTAQGHAIAVIDDLSTGRAVNLPPSADLQIFDLVDGPTAEVVASVRPETVIHCAAQASVVRLIDDPARDALVNIVGSIRLIEAARYAGAKRFVYVTTGGALYGNPTTIPVPETHRIGPLSPYGVSKWTVEHYLAVLAGAMTVVVLRLANVYGPRQSPEGEAGVVSFFLDRMQLGRPVEVHGDGGQTRDFVHVADVVEAVEAAVMTPGSITVNIGTGRATSIRDLFDLIAAVSGYEGEPISTPSRVGDIRQSVLAVERVKSELGWQARTSLEDGLRSTAAWFSKQS